MILRAVVDAVLALLEQDQELAARARRLLAAEPAAPVVEGFLTRRQARAVFGLEARAIIRAERAGALPAYRAGRAVTYARADLGRLVEHSRVVSQTQTDADDPLEQALARGARKRAGSR